MPSPARAVQSAENLPAPIHSERKIISPRSAERPGNTGAGSAGINSRNFEGWEGLGARGQATQGGIIVTLRAVLKRHMLRNCAAKWLSC